MTHSLAQTVNFTRAVTNVILFSCVALLAGGSMHRGCNTADLGTALRLITSRNCHRMFNL